MRSTPLQPTPELIRDPHSPIADLSYRNYDGPLEDPRMRWWVIAKATIRVGFRRKIVWLWATLSAVYFIFLSIILFFLEQIAGTSGNDQASKTFVSRLIWKDQFYHGFGYGQLFFLALTLTIGVGTIANDNRANALLVYLSKPVTKLDYVIGKWVGVFVPLFAISVIPAFVFYLYGALSFRSYGFLADDVWLLPKVIVALTVSSAFQSSLVVGFSSLFNQGRLAGAAYAGLYFLTNFVTKLVGVSWGWMSMNSPDNPLRGLVRNLYYLSIDGLNIAQYKMIIGTDGSPPFGIPARTPVVSRPDLWLVIVGVGGLTLLSLFVAWRRVRAVEVVR